jgi:hypothetical protein
MNPSDTTTETTTPPIEFAIVQGSSSGVVSLLDTKIQLSEDTTFEQWREGLKIINWFDKKLAIGLASYIDWGNIQFGTAKVNEALEQLQFEATLVKTAVAVTSIPTELRFPNLEGGHYVELAKADLTKPKGIHWARIASEQNLTPSQLRFSIIEGAVVDKSATRALESGVVTIHGIRQQFDVWFKRVGEMDGISKMDTDNKQDILEELDGIANVWAELKEHLEEAEPIEMKP